MPKSAFNTCTARISGPGKSRRRQSGSKQREKHPQSSWTRTVIRSIFCTSAVRRNGKNVTQCYRSSWQRRGLGAVPKAEAREMVKVTCNLTVARAHSHGQIRCLTSTRPRRLAPIWILRVHSRHLRLVLRGSSSSSLGTVTAIQTVTATHQQGPEEVLGQHKKDPAGRVPGRAQTIGTFHPGLAGAEDRTATDTMGVTAMKLLPTVATAQ
mmetsp:Transcript_21251/g.49440  ORF Transcript_21251/g.49440 Transcript_21251/m.49440 type:complete len:210 (+) Transcript_21251:258-887(+)